MRQYSLVTRRNLRLGLTKMVLFTGLFITCIYGQLACQKETFIPPWSPEADEQGTKVVAVYESRIPCADCERTKVALVLYGASLTKVTSYRLARVYVGKNDDRLESAGPVTVGQGIPGYPLAYYYKLEQSGLPEFEYYWLINDELVFILDQFLKPRVGNPAHGYVLNRTR